MLKQNPKILGLTAQLLDLLTLVSAFFISFPVRNSLLKWIPYGSPIHARAFIGLLLLHLIVWWVLLRWQEVYGPQRLMSLSSLARKIAKTAVYGTFVSLGVIYLAGLSNIPRTLILTFTLIGFLSLMVEKFFWLKFLEYIHRYGRGLSDVLIVGCTDIAEEFVESLNQYSDWGLNIVGFVIKNGGGEKSFAGRPVLGAFHDLPALLHRHPVDEVIFALPASDIEEVREMIDICEVEGVRTRIIFNFYPGIVFKAEADVIHDIPIITYIPALRKEWHLMIKRALDICVASIVLVLLAPLFGLIALIIRLTSPGPVFYRWKVVGLNKRAFTSYKFRTMVINADDLKEELQQQNEMKGPAFKMKKDPRITGVGRYLRKYSLDELPQFWSVLKGDMSIVGPHPPLQAELHHFDNWHRRKLSVKPGITCLWQINGRSDIKDFDEWVKMDLEYIDNWSLWLDTKILFKTIPVVLFGKGAY